MENSELETGLKDMTLEPNINHGGSTSLDGLSAELLIMISEYLSNPDLKATSLCNHRLHNVGIRQLYRTIDLSWHHRDPKPFTSTPEYARLRGEQYRFAKQTHEKPEYAKLVTTIIWTITPHEPWGLSMPKGVLQKEYQWTPKAVIDMFSRLSNVIRVDIDTGGGHLLPSIPIPPLFPNAQFIRLGGKMHFEFASAILHGPGKSHLKSLTLNNVQEGGRLASGENFRYKLWPENEYPKMFDPTELSEIWPWDVLPIQVWPGGMRRLFNQALIDRCQDLQVLEIYIQGERVSGRYKPYFALDEQLYSELAAFITGTQTRSLLLAQKSAEDPTPSIVSPMDERFNRVIIPVLKRELFGLSRLEIQGVPECFLAGLSTFLGDQGLEVKMNEFVDYPHNGCIGVD